MLNSKRRVNDPIHLYSLPESNIVRSRTNAVSDLQNTGRTTEDHRERTGPPGRSHAGRQARLRPNTGRVQRSANLPPTGDARSRGPLHGFSQYSGRTKSITNRRE